MTVLSSFPPGLILVLGALLLPFLPGIFRQIGIVGLPAIALWAVWQVPDGVQLTVPFLDYVLEPVEGTRVGRVFATVFAIMALTGGVFGMRQSRTLEVVAGYAYAGSAMGVAFAGDLITMFVFWELMAVGSTLVIWAAGTEGAYRAARRYLQIHLFGGVVLMIGVVGFVLESGSVDFVAMRPESFATWMILIGFLINAGAPPFSAWLPDAYPEASPSGAVFLSAFTTKTAVFVLWIGFPGTELLIYVGLYMACYGIIYALLENDMRRILAYSIINQVGFMVCAIGIGTELALNGAAAHAFTHIIYKALLLMSAGSVMYMTGKRKCTDLGGLYKTMPLTCICGTIGALAISSFPLTSGFVSKSMINLAAADEHLTLAWFVLTAASAGVFLHAGIKFPWFVFFQKDSGLRPKEPPFNMKLGMIFFAFLCIALGVMPGPLYAILPFPVDYVPYTTAHVAEMLQLLLFSGLAFFVLLPAMKRTLTISLDFDWFYRVAGPYISHAIVHSLSLLGGSLERFMTARIKQGITWIEKHHGLDGMMAKTLPAGTMALVVIAVLVVYLVIYLLR